MWPAYETDWWSEHIPPRHASIIPLWTEGQKCYSNEHLKLAIIGKMPFSVDIFITTADAGQPPAGKAYCALWNWGKSRPDRISMNRYLLPSDSGETLCQKSHRRTLVLCRPGRRRFLWKLLKQVAIDLSASFTDRCSVALLLLARPMTR